MKKVKCDRPVVACALLLAVYAVEYAAFCIFVPEKWVMDVALIVSFILLFAVALLLELHNKKEKNEISISPLVAAILIIVGISLVGLERRFVDIGTVPYFSNEVNKLYIMFTVALFQFAASRKARGHNASDEAR